jgi:phosphohistidine phosphatase
MPRYVWLMRHGQAEDPDTAGTDEERALTDIGRQQVLAAAAWLKERTQSPTLIWHSPVRRAKETAYLVAEALGGTAQLEEQPLLEPGMYPARLFAAVAATSDPVVLCVGHQPDIGAAIQDAIGGGRYGVAPGTIAALEFPSTIAPGSAALRWFADPRWFGG